MEGTRGCGCDGTALSPISGLRLPSGRRPFPTRPIRRPRASGGRASGRAAACLCAACQLTARADADVSRVLSSRASVGYERAAAVTSAAAVTARSRSWWRL